MNKAAILHWEFVAFAELDARQLYCILKARTEVFVVEQNCVYQDMDDIDQISHHLIGWGAPSKVAGYLRLVPPGGKYREPSIGRVLTTRGFRTVGVGRELMNRGLAEAKRLYPAHGNRISAQAYLENFYQSFGFGRVSKPYDEDGIPHIEMMLAAKG
jgi:ElaA protein